MATRPPESPPQSPKPGELIKPKHGRGLLRHGSLPGTHRGGSGRPPEEFKAALAAIADNAVKKGYVEQILTDPEHQHFMRALEWATERGYGKVETKIDAKVSLAGVVVLPAIVPDPPDDMPNGE